MNVEAELEEKREMSFMKTPHEKTSSICPECGSKNLINDSESGEIACGGCGLVKDTTVSLIKPSINEIKRVFLKCHNLIFKRESLLPTQAFYEFTKLMFLKMNEDRRLHEILKTGRELKLEDLHFHTHWIDVNLTVTPNPVNAILFKKLVGDLEELVDKKKKKPILMKFD